MKRTEKQQPSTPRISCCLLLLLCGSLALAACGQRGPLYLPEKPDQAAPAPIEPEEDRQEDAQISRT